MFNKKIKVENFKYTDKDGNFGMGYKLEPKYTQKGVSNYIEKIGREFEDELNRVEALNVFEPFLLSCNNDEVLLALGMVFHVMELKGIIDKYFSGEIHKFLLKNPAHVELTQLVYNACQMFSLKKEG